MKASEIIIEVGAEGGSIQICGIRTEQGWLFSRRVDDCNSELVGEGRNHYTSPTVDSWEAALQLLDRYAWHKLFPIAIHPEFKGQILVAVQQRLQADDDVSESDFDRWPALLSESE